MKNILKRATALMLSLLMVFSVCSTSLIIYATDGSEDPGYDIEKLLEQLTKQYENDITLSYVSLGDSMTNGYGLTGYGDGRPGASETTHANSGVEDYADGAYPNQFAELLEDVYGDGNVDHAQLAMSGIRTEDIHWLLELDYDSEETIEFVQWAVDNQGSWNEVVAKKWNEKFGCGDFWTVNEIINHSRTEWTRVGIQNKLGISTDYNWESCSASEKIALIAEYYQEHVADADIISLSVGNGNIGVFGFGRILEAIGFDPDDTYLNYNYEHLLRECTPEMKNRLTTMINELTTGLSDFEMLSTKPALKDVVIYIAVSLAMNYAGTLDAILQMNPDVDIILVPVMNTFGDPEGGFEEGSLGAMMEYVVEPINKFIAALPTYMQVTNHGVYKDAKFYYAEPDFVECMVATYEAPLTGLLRDRFVESIVGENGDGMIWGMLNGDPKNPADDMVVTITADDIAGYEQALAKATHEHVKCDEKCEENCDKHCLWDEENEFAACDKGPDTATWLNYVLAHKDKMQSIVIYLAFEDAIVSGKDATVYLDAVMGLGGELSLDGVMNDYAARVQAGVNEHTLFVCGALANAAELTLESKVNGMLKAKDFKDAEGEYLTVDLTITTEQIMALIGGVDGAADALAAAVVADLVDVFDDVYAAKAAAGAQEAVDTLLEKIESGVNEKLAQFAEQLYAQLGVPVELDAVELNALGYMNEGINPPLEKLDANMLAQTFYLDATDGGGFGALVLAPYVDKALNEVLGDYADTAASMGLTGAAAVATVMDAMNAEENAEAKEALDLAVAAAGVLYNAATLLAPATEEYLDQMISEVAGEKVTAKAYVASEVAKSVDAGTATLLCTLLATPDALSGALQNPENGMDGLLALFARCVIGNGIGAHPSQAGHDTLAAAVINAYANDNTAEDKTDENIGFEDMPVVKKIISDLTAQGYLNDDQILDIAFEVYDNYKANNGKINLFAVIDKVYNVLFQIGSDNLNDAQRLEIIGIIYFDLKNAEEGYLKAYDKYLPTLEELVEKLVPYVTDKQAFDIVEKAYGMTGAQSDAGIQISDTEQDALVDYVYTMLIKENDPEKATAIIEVVYSVLKKNGYLDANKDDLATVEAILAIPALAKVSDASAVAITNYIYEQLTSETGVDVMNVVDFIYETIFATEAKELTASEKLEVIVGVYSVLKANGYLDANKDDLATVEAILAIPALAKVSDASAVAITNYIYEQLTSETGVDVMNVVDFIYETIFATEANELTAAEKLEVVVGVYNILTDAGKFVAYAEIFEVIEAIIEADVIAHLSAEETWGIIDTIYGLYINDKSIEGDTLAIVQIVYETVLLNDKLDEEARVNLIFTVYGVLNDAFAFGSIFDSFVKIAKELVANKQIRPLQAFAIVHVVYLAYANNGAIDSTEFRVIANIVYYVILGRPQKAKGGSGIDWNNFTLETFQTELGGDMEKLFAAVQQDSAVIGEKTPEEKVAVIKAVVNAVPEEVKTENKQVGAVTDLVTTLTGADGGEQLLEDKQLANIIDSAFANLVAPDPESVKIEDAIANITQTVVEELVGMEPDKFDKVMEAVKETVGQLGGTEGEGGEGGSGIVIPEITIPDEVKYANELAYILEQEGLIDDAQRGELVKELTSVLFGKTTDPMDLIDNIYSIIYKEGFDIETTVKFVVVIATFAYEKRDVAFNAANPYYAQAMAQVLTEENIAKAIISIDSAIAAIDSAIAALSGKARANMGDTTALKAALVEELEVTKDTLDHIKVVLESDALKNKTTNEYEIQATIAALLTFEEDLWAHANSIAKIATEAGIFATPYIQAVIAVINDYAAIAAEMVQEAYDWCVANVQGFVADYYALANEMKNLVSKIDENLGEAVYDFMIEVPSDTIKLLYLYGEGAVDKLILDAVAAGEDIYDAVAGLAYVLKKHGKDIYDAVRKAAETDPAFKDIYDELQKVYAEIEKIEVNAPSDLGGLGADVYARLDELKAEAAELAGMFYEAALVAINASNPAAGEALEDAITALTTVLNTIGTTSGEYVGWLGGETAALGGNLLKAFLENWDELYGAAYPVFEGIFCCIYDAVEDYVNDFIDEASNRISATIDTLTEILKDLKEQVKDASGAIADEINKQIDALNKKIDELKGMLEDLKANIIEAGKLINEIKNDVIDLIDTLKKTAYDEAYKALTGIVEDLKALGEFIGEVAGERFQALQEKLGEAAVKFFTSLIKEGIALLPEIDQKLYDYFYNNPDEVIAFFKEYGDEIVELFKEYGDEALVVIAAALATFGTPLAKYIVENHEEVLAGLTAWADKYGDRVVAILQVYAEELGICDVVRNEIARLEAERDALIEKLENLNEQLQTAVGEAREAIEAEIAKVKAEIAKIQAQINTLIEKLQNLDDVVANLNAALQEFAQNAGAAAAQAVAEALADLKKAVEDLMNNVSNEVAAQLREILSRTGELAKDLIEDLAQLVVDAVIKFAPELDEYLYNYLINNAEQVIEFFKQYGDDIIDLCEKYGEEALAVIVIALVNFGDELADYIINNSEAVLEGLIAWAEEYGDRIVEMMKAYAEALGICDIVREEIAKLEAKRDALVAQLKALNAQLQNAIGEAKKAIEAEIAKVQAELARVQAKLDELNAKLQALVNAIYQLDDALKQFVTEAIETATAAVIAAIDNLNKAVKDLLDSVSDDVAAKLEQLIKTGIGLTKELIADLAKLAVEAVIKFAPELDAYLYDYFYNNPDEVIAYFNEYGDDIIDLCKKYGDKALAVVAIALAYYGDDLATYILENPDEVLAGLNAWADKYGDRIIAIMQVYAEALGLCDAVREEIADLEAKRDALVAQLKALNAQLQNAIGEAKKAIEAEIAKVQAELARVQAKLDELNAKLQALVNAIYQLDDALKQFVTEAIETATAAVIAAIDNLNKAVKDLLDSVSDDVAAKLEQLIKTGIGLTKELIADLAKLAVEAVIKFAPELDAYLYDYFYNNPEEVIAFFNEYGDEIIELCKKYGDKALAVVALALAYYGPELAEYIINNPEDVLAGICAWADKYGDRVVAILQVYAEALGLCDAVRGEVDALNDKLAALQAELMKQLNILQNELQAELNDLYAQLKDAVDAQKAIILEKIKEIESKIELVQQYIAELQAKIAELQVMIAELNAKLQALINAIYNLDDALKTLINVGIEAGIAGVQSALNAVAVAIRDLVGVVSGDIAAQIDQLLAKAKDYLNNAYNSAIIADYVIDNMSNYVALGDNKAYADLFAQYLINEVAKADVGYTYKVNTALVQNGSKINTLPVIINTNLNAIAGADLISIGYSFDKIAENTMLMAIELLMDGKTSVPTDFNWATLVGAEAGAEVEKLVADIYSTMLNEGLGISIAEATGGLFASELLLADVVITAVEYFAYSAIEYAAYLPQAVGMINQINPDAIIMINAISNPISGAKLSFFGQELVFGDYLDYVCDAIYVETAVLATMYENVVFVPTTEVETTLTDYTISMNSSQDLKPLAQLLTALMENQAINTTPNGNAYVCEKMADALNITVKDSVLLGDVNSDGVVNALDVMYYQWYLVGMIGEDQFNLAAADVDGMYGYNALDIMHIRWYLVGMITEFPAE